MVTNDQNGNGTQPDPNADFEAWQKFQQFQEWQKAQQAHQDTEPEATAPADQASPAAQPEPAPVPAPAQPVQAQPAPTQSAPAPEGAPAAAAPVAATRPKGNGGLKALLSVLSLLLVASLAANGLLFTGIITSPFAGALGAPAAGPTATGTPTQVFLAPAAAPGAGAFSNVSLTNIVEGGVAQATTGPVSSDLEPANARTVSAADPGTFGLSVSGCSRSAFAEDLSAELAAVWLGPANADPTLVWEGGQVAAEDISAYFRQLNTVTLPNDTLVTYYTLDGSTLTSVPAVLQKGSVVLVDRAGQIRMRCVSGNPVGPAPADILPVYQGEAWADFDPALVVSIEPAEELLSVPLVRFPATAAGELVPVTLYGCLAEGDCLANGPALELPAAPDNTPPLPTVTDCNNVPGGAAYDVAYRVHNASGADLALFTIVSGTCEVQYQATVQAGTGLWWGVTDVNPDGGQFLGAEYVFTDGTSTEILHRVSVDANGQVDILR